jgi:hypothetical protein
MIYLMVSLFTALSIQGVSEPLRDCSLQSLGDPCELSKATKKGLNPWRLEAENQQMVYDSAASMATEQLQAYSQANSEQMLKHQDFNLKTQADVLMQLEIGSPEFKLALSSPYTLSTLGYLLEPKQEESAFEMKISVPWPPEGPGQKTQMIDVKTFKDLYWSKISANEQKVLRNAWRGIEAESARLATGYSGYGVQPQLAAPKVDPQQLTSSVLNRMKSEQNERGKKLFELAKTYLIDEIKQRTPNKADVETLVKKLEGVKYSGFDPGASSCQQSQLNAFYKPVESSVTLCGDYSTASDGALIATLGHELGHSIDPCNCAGSSIHIKKSQVEIDQIKSEGKLESLSREDWEVLDMRPTDPSAPLYGISDLLTPRAREALKLNGIIEENTSGIDGPYPFATTYRCLSSRHKFADASEISPKAIFNRRLKRGDRSLGDKAVSPLFTNPSLRECLVKERSEMGEAMSDVFGAKVLGRYMLDQPNRKFSDLAQSAPIYFKALCLKEDNSVSGVHPYSSERLEKIILAEPLVQKAFGCKETKDSFCLKKFGHLPHQLDSGKKDRLAPGTAGSEKAVK